MLCGSLVVVRAEGTRSLLSGELVHAIAINASSQTGRFERHSTITLRA